MSIQRTDQQVEALGELLPQLAHASANSKDKERCSQARRPQDEKTRANARHWTPAEAEAEQDNPPESLVARDGGINFGGTNSN